MDEEKREKEKREKADESEIRKDRFRAFFAELRNMLQTHGYPVKGDRAKASESTTALPQPEEANVTAETSTEASAWIPSFQSYEDFHRMALQSLDGFMIILSADGVIIFVADNISSLLGYSPDEVVGKKLLSLLPDVEKSEVYRKIALKHPLSSSVGRHIEFCCHFRRGNIQCGGIITYEYVKFILGIKDISNEPLVLFTTFFPSQPYNKLYGANLPLEDRFYLVGSVCVLRAEVLREFFTPKETSEDIQPAQDLDEDEEYQSEEGRCLQGQRRSSRMKAVCSEREASAEDDQIDTVTAAQYAPQDSSNVISIDSDSPTDSSTSLNTIPESPATSSLQSFQLEPEMEQMDEVNETEEVGQKEDLDQMREMEDTEQMEKMEQPLQPSSPVAPHISRHELELMKKFTKQLDERTRRLQADLTSQRSALEAMKQQLQAMQGHKYQLPASCRPESPELQTLEPVPKKQVKRSRSNRPDLREVKHFRGASSHSVKISEELENLREQQMEEEELPEQQMEEQYVDEEKLLEQQVEEEQLPEQDMDKEKLPEQQTQHKVMPVNLVAEPPPSDCYQDESLGDQDGAHSFPQSPISSDSNTFPLETPQEHLADPQPQLHQVQAPAGRAQSSPEPEAFQEAADPLPDQESFFAPGEPSDVDEQQCFTGP
ncbi:circadian clock protein PASD1 isoform X2 [Talpa occidentalis]|uniref:circadian clock protein PASD1 isoform X2 n=1 Tax=Talpa occidentalis TaxID=50954 RepID=UPI00188F466A|nr:circadian clock protein PASD1 isoform X2 [Talpa occidentalis]